MSNGNSDKILLVEDDPNIVELILRSLKKHNLANKVHVVKDGAEALEYIFCTGAYAHRKIINRPKLVLLNLKLPKVDGFEVLKKIKSDERTKIIPVVMLTSSEEDQDMVQSYKLGANSYIVKPVEFEEFTRLVTEVVLYWILLNKVP